MMTIDEISRVMIAIEDTIVIRCRLNQLLFVSFNLYSYLLNKTLSLEVELTSKYYPHGGHLLGEEMRGHWLGVLLSSFEVPYR